MCCCYYYRLVVAYLDKYTGKASLGSIAFNALAKPHFTHRGGILTNLNSLCKKTCGIKIDQIILKILKKNN